MADGVRSDPSYGGWKGGLATVQFRSHTSQRVIGQGRFIRLNHGGLVRRNDGGQVRRYHGGDPVLRGYGKLHPLRILHPIPFRFGVPNSLPSLVVEVSMLKLDFSHS